MACNSPLQSAPVSAREAVRDAVMALQRAGVETASLDARVLLEYVLGASREELLAAMDVPIDDSQNAAYRELVKKRARRCPVSQLTGRREFWGLTFKVTADTLDPRPDSETLVEAVLEAVEGGTWNVKRDNVLPRATRHMPQTILDLGTGTGCLLIALLRECKNAEGIGVDLSDAAIAVARENAAALGVGNRARFIAGNWNAPLDGRFDSILSNPPYIPTGEIATLAPEVAQHEPKLALDGGADGLDAYRAILPRLSGLLAERGRAFLEIGKGQEEDVITLARQSGLAALGVKQDLGGVTRCVMLAMQN
ncbi:MAG: peptide chain release factor N(5)-glutamine methyltransferase [Pseudomonadota bacterium]|nr:peptide chain release factor N(5)-glutamine methyltransferase [Pseudomonadota bacterium]MDE3038039.1 peptide chain release factor N(5)-glutamine methyltransferase [Pseudomonadota bacterium]